jgi:hypothetical protein
MCDNDSPFFQTISYTLYVEPYLNTYSKQYQNIITIDKKPVGPLAQLVSHYNQSVIPLEENDTSMGVTFCFAFTTCILVVYR